MRYFARIRASHQFMIAVLMLAYVHSGFDRFIVSVLVEPIKAHFRVSDAEIGLLQGFAYIVVIAVASLPLGWLVDRVRRVTLLAIGICAWSALTGLAALAPGFYYLLATRGGVALGEAVLAPTAYSLISDRIDASRRGTAIGIYHGVGGVLGGAALMLGGQLVQSLENKGPMTLPVIGLVEPWQLTLILVGIPGFFVAAATLLIPEPVRLRSAADRTTGSFETVRHFYRENAGFVIPHHLATGLMGLSTASTMAWIVPFMIRDHSVSSATAGTVAGAIFLAAHIGMMASGWLSDKALVSASIGRLAVCIWTIIPGAAIAVMFPLVGSTMTAIVMSIALMALIGSPYGVATAAIQDVAPGEIRGIVSAVFLFVNGTLGGCGPFIVGAISDRYGLKIALLATLPVALAAAVVLFWLAGKNLHSKKASKHALQENLI